MPRITKHPPEVNAQDVARWLHETALRVAFAGVKGAAPWEELEWVRRDHYLKVAQVMLDTPPPGFRRA